MNNVGHHTGQCTTTNYTSFCSKAKVVLSGPDQEHIEDKMEVPADKEVPTAKEVPADKEVTTDNAGNSIESHVEKVPGEGMD